ncbi:hypothetical protein PTKIN_Ptkin06aG0055900 [Pterospermum kingtungense]
MFLLKIARRISRPLKVDDTILEVSRGRFVRVCVDIDGLKPLLSKFRLRKKIHHIEYEALDLICFQCGKYGHRKEDCKNEKFHSENHETPNMAAKGDESNSVLDPSETYG